AIVWCLTIPGAATALPALNGPCTFTVKAVDESTETVILADREFVNLSGNRQLTCRNGTLEATVMARTARVDGVVVQGDLLTFDTVTLELPARASFASATEYLLALTGAETAPVERAVVVADNGRELTDGQVERLLADPSAFRDAPVLRV